MNSVKNAPTMSLRRLAIGLIVLFVVTACTSVENLLTPDPAIADSTATDSTAAQSAPNKKLGRETKGNLVTQGVPELDPQVVQTLSRFRNTRSAYFAGFGPQGILIKTRFGQTNQLHQVATPLAARRQLTYYAEPIGEVALPQTANASGFVFAKDVGGSEFYQLFWHEWESGKAKMLTDGKSRYSNVVFARHSEQFAYTSTERDSVHFDIYVRDADSAAKRILTVDDGLWMPMHWSADGKRLLVLKYVSPNQSYLYEVTVATGVQRLVAGADNATFIGGAVYGPNDESVYLLSDAGSDFVTLRKRSLASGREELLTNHLQGGVEGLTIAGDASKLAFTLNESGASGLYMINTNANSKAQRIDSLPNGVIEQISFSPAADTLAVTLNRPTRPSDVYVIDVTGRAAVQWTASEVGGLNVDKFIEPKLVTYTSFEEEDGTAREISAFVYLPPGPGPHPVLMQIHGGPAAQYRPRFSPTIQYFANELGIAVVAPNVRGSAGYGKRFLTLDDGFKREDSVKDIGALLDWIDENPTLDAQHVGVLGASYGGYMVLATMTNYPKRIAAGIDVVGISDFVTFLENTQEYRRDLRRVEYGDERDPAMREFLTSIAPLGRVEQITKPLLVAQGFNDPRVPASESEQIVAALDARDIPVWYLLFMDEGHGFRKKSNADYSAAAYAMFLRQYLLPSE